jgi:hypothetical protein
MCAVEAACDNGWPETPLAHELTAALMALRETLQSDTTGIPSMSR